MAKTGKIKKISISHIDEVMKENYNNVVTKDWFGADLVIRKTISFIEYMNVIDAITRACFDSAGVYYPGMMDFAIRCCVISVYANVNIPSDNDKQYNIAMNSGLYEEIVKEINIEQLNTIKEAVELNVKHIADAMALESKAKIEETGKAFEEMATSFGSLFNGISEEDIKNAAKLIESVGDKEILNAVINNGDKQ